MGVHVGEVVDRGLGRRMALTEVDSCVGVVSAWLLDTSCGGSIGVLVDRRLHLLKELIDARQIALGSQVGQWQGVLVLGNMTMMTTAATMTIDRNKSWCRHVVRSNTATLDRNTLKSNQSLTNLVIGRGVDAVALEVTKEIVQGVVVASSNIEGSVLANVAAMRNRIVNGTVRRLLRLLGSVVAVVSGMVGSGIARSGTRVHLTIVVSTVYCKVLQVSNH